MDTWAGQSRLQMSSLLGQGHDDLENDPVRRRHVTGEGHNGDNITTNTAAAPLTGNLRLSCVLTLGGIIIKQVCLLVRSFVRYTRCDFL